ncbi:hypothetical protein M3Y94_01251300 [Aphelenchoides besseyi]|nr:hypothetical protein M3Y94_01251300 [Aphelenchoides besseyi]
MLDRLIDCGLLIYSIPQTIAELMRNPLGFKTINDWSSLRYEYYGATKTTKLIHTPEEEEIELLRRFFNEQVNGKNYRFMNSGLQNSSTLGNGGVRDSLFDEPLNSLDDLVPRTTTSVQDVDEMLNLYLPADFMDEISDSFVCLVRDTEDLDPERPFHQRSASYLLGQNVPDVDTPDNTNIDSTDDESADNATSHSNSSSANSTVSTSLLGKRNSTTVLAVVKTVSSAKSRKAND